MICERSARSGVPLICLLGALNAGILATHTMVPPTPGPLAATGTLGADLGMAIALGLVSAAAYTVAGTLCCKSRYCVSRYPEPAKAESIEQSINDGFTLKTDRKLPNAPLTFACILVPVILICVHSFMDMALPAEAEILKHSAFIGDPVIALFIGVFLCLFLDTSKLNKEQIYKWFDKSVEGSGFIILATGAVLQASGVGTYLGNLIAATHPPAVFVPFLVSLLLSVSNGSATVSLTTGSAIILPLMPALGLHPAIAVLAIAAGSSFFYHANTSHFWVVCRSNDIDMKEGLTLCSAGTAIGSVAAFIAVWIMSIFVTA